MKRQILSVFVTLFALSFSTIYAAESPPLIITPEENSTVIAGQPFTITIDAPPEVGEIGGYVYLYQPWEYTKEIKQPISFGGTPPFTIEMTVPWQHVGPFEFKVSASNDDRSFDLKPFPHTLIALPDPTDLPIELSMSHGLYFDAPTAENPAESRSIGLYGIYANDITRTLKLEILGTRYTVHNPSVASITDGIVSPLSPGSTFITVEHGTLQDFIDVTVVDPTTNTFPPKENTNNVIIDSSGFQRDPVTGKFIQQVTITNTIDLPLAKPLNLILAGLSNGVILENGGSQTKVINPGSDVIYIDMGMRAFLRPGEQATVTLKFKNKDNLPIQYTPRLFTGSDL